MRWQDHQAVPCCHRTKRRHSRTRAAVDNGQPVGTGPTQTTRPHPISHRMSSISFLLHPAQSYPYTPAIDWPASNQSQSPILSSQARWHWVLRINPTDPPSLLKRPSTSGFCVLRRQHQSILIHRQSSKSFSLSWPEERPAQILSFWYYFAPSNPLHQNKKTL